jgi:hypothetical protein
MPWKLEWMLMTSSGAEVQKATIVSPIRRLESQNFFANDEAQSTSKSPPLMRKRKPIMKRKRVRKVIS